MSKEEKIITFGYIGLFLGAVLLILALIVGQNIKNKYPVTRVYEDGSFYGCQRGALCEGKTPKTTEFINKLISGQLKNE